MKKKMCLLGIIVSCICIVVSLLPKVEMYLHAYRCTRELYKIKSRIDTSDNSTVLIKLNSENSIYYEKDIYLNSNNPEVECYQYMILFSDSQAANKYYKK